MRRRVLRRVWASLGKLDGAAEENCIHSVRAYIASVYPHPDPAHLIRIVRSFRLSEFPLSLLIAGGVGDETGSGARASIERAFGMSDGFYGDPHPLFSSSFYRYSNPDVEGAAVAPWVHYQTFGLYEHRSPHPLLDSSFMAQWLPEVSPDSIVDSYLSDPQLWTIDTSPYVDTQRFVLESTVDGTVPPILRIVTSPAPETWLSFKLMLIDSGSASIKAARLNAATFLVSRQSPSTSPRVLRTWGIAPSDDVQLPERSAVFTVVPGYFLGADSSCFATANSETISADMTVVRLPTEFLSIANGPSFSAGRLIFVMTALDRDSAEKLMAEQYSTVVIAPRSAAQEAALQVLSRELALPHVVVLPYGLQARIETAEVEIVGNEPDAIPGWDWSAPVSARDVAFLVAPEGNVLDSESTELMGRWVASGSSVLALNAATLPAWAHLLARPCVVVQSDMVELVRPLVPEGTLRVFEQREFL